MRALKISTRDLAALSLCAALYAAGSFITAYVESPWGHGQVRPAVALPAAFAVLFGPFVGGLGAGFGTLIADSVKHGYIYPPSLFGAAPGNFVCFSIIGYVCRRRFTWIRFILSTVVGFALGSTLIAVALASLGAIPYQVMTFVGAWVFVTGVVPIVILDPPILEACFRAFPQLRPPRNENK